MAIYLDANILHGWRTFTELDRVALAVVASQRKQLIFVPWLVALEAERQYRAGLEAIVRDLDELEAKVAQAFPGHEVSSQPWPHVDDHVDEWCRHLRVLAETLPRNGDDAIEALEREVGGISPALRKVDGKGRDTGGAGARDAAIWLAIKRDHCSRNEDGHFITADGHFLNQERNGLQSELHGELPVDAGAFRAYAGIADFLGLLGEQVAVRVELDDLAQRVPSVLSQALSVTTHIPRAILDDDENMDDWTFRTTVKQCTPTRVIDARLYEAGKRSVTVVNSEWNVTADCFLGRRPPEGTADVAGHLEEDVHLSGTVQLYLPSREQPNALPQFVSSRLATDTTLFVRGDGSAFSVRSTKNRKPR
ncbi:MAG TPA: PIN domain-containing protein [Microbacteriaceae bacterium]|jgi:hypothetical protein|nr:PIN domain-containing protein [Microbacteriaceae bacterium]